MAPQSAQEPVEDPGNSYDDQRDQRDERDERDGEDGGAKRVEAETGPESPETDASEDESFRIAVKVRVADGQPNLCADCFQLILDLQKRVPRRSFKWKTVLDLVFDGAFRRCELCELVASAPPIYLDDLDHENKYPLRPLKTYEKSFTNHPDLAILRTISDLGPIEAFGHENAVTRICEVSFFFKFDSRPAEVVLAVWLEPMPEMKFNPFRRFENPQPERCEGVHTGSDITWRRPLTSNVSWRTFELFETWMSTCLLDHEECSQTLSNQLIDNPFGDLEGLRNTDLPSRVLEVLGEDENKVKLVDTRNSPLKRAPYVALSHCWGPPDKQPLQTTLDNLSEHTTTGIPLASFPKTFRDAIYITRQLSLPYLWIDSLCIIQDSQPDWLSESEKMGAIYERAALTIAASSARDSSEGCFLAERPTHSPYSPDTPNIVRFVLRFGLSPDSPYFKTCFAALPISLTANPYFSPLGHRAWACQEWYLSRRILFCTSAGFMWKCRHSAHNERGRHVEMNEGREWECLMERYSESWLTRESDRLVAVKGIVNELGKVPGRRGRVECAWGQWVSVPGAARAPAPVHLEEMGDPGNLLEKTDVMDEVVVGLCWMVREFLPQLQGEGAQGAPSWSWASVPGPKTFWRVASQFFYPSRDLVAANRVTVGGLDKKVLTIERAKLRRARVRLLEDEELEFQPALMDTRVWAAEGSFIGRRRHRHDSMPVHSILSDDPSEADRTRAVGLAAFDRLVDIKAPGLAGKEIHVVLLVESPRFAFDPFLSDGGGSTWRGQDISGKVCFMDLTKPQQDGSLTIQSAAKLRENGAQRTYGVMVRTWNDALKPMNDYTPPPPEDFAQMKDAMSTSRYIYDGEGTSVFWALLLEPVCDTVGMKMGSYRRVGMGLIGNEKWLDTAVCQDINIV